MIEMIYAVIGPGTLRMTTLRPGDEVNVIGPLGNGFSGWEGKRLAILIAGGMGAPPLQHLAAHLRRICPETEVVMFAGARSIDDLPFTIAPDESAVELSEIDIEAHICTDDGSVGFAGFVTGCAAKWLENRSFVASETAIYSCGPEVMLSAVASLGRANDIECQVSMERMMGCGIGLCQSCAVEVKAGGDETAYKLCCKDGPVFDSKDVCFSV